ncbi:MAG: hypothetical protein QOJ97_2413 [Solirubrobacteraceae bacterium]|nr:hypothetical protein [Solirubrobacteraceae bacterium]
MAPRRRKAGSLGRALTTGHIAAVFVAPGSAISASRDSLRSDHEASWTIGVALPATASGADGATGWSTPRVLASKAVSAGTVVTPAVAVAGGLLARRNALAQELRAARAAH